MASGAAMRAALVASSDPAWPEALSHMHHDSYHLPAFAEFAARWHTPGTPVAFLAEEGGRKLLVPLLVRQIPQVLAEGAPWLDATSPRGYPGPVVGTISTEVDDAFVERALAALVDTLRDHRIVTAFIRCHPLLTPRLELLSSLGDVQEHGESVSIDLADSPDHLWKQMRQNHRRSITRARREGYTVRIDGGWDRLEDFAVIYSASMERLDAAGHWRLPKEYFDDFRTAVGPAVKLCLVEHDGELAAAAILTEVDGIVEYHLSGTAAKHAHASPTKLLIEEASRWARERGNRVFHLAGSLRPDDSLMRFKRGFSPLLHTVASWRLIADPAANSLLAERAKSLNQQPPVGSDAGFFPKYRGLSPTQPSTQPDTQHPDQGSVP